MKKSYTSKISSDSFENDSDVMTQIVKIKKQLDIVEKKIDSLLNQSTPQQSRKSHFPQRQFSHQSRGSRDYGSPTSRGSVTQVTCSACHKPCKIPFKPTGNRPVYCSDCFSKQKKGDSSQRNRFDKPKKDGFKRYFNKKKR